MYDETAQHGPKFTSTGNSLADFNKDSWSWAAGSLPRFEKRKHEKYLTDCALISISDRMLNIWNVRWKHTNCNKLEMLIADLSERRENGNKIWLFLQLLWRRRNQPALIVYPVCQSFCQCFLQMEYLIMILALEKKCKKRKNGKRALSGFELRLGVESVRWHSRFLSIPLAQKKLKNGAGQKLLILNYYKLGQ
jgi:hypothetical protein